MLCVSCRIEMPIVKNGVQVRWNGQTVRRGDRYQCPKCKNEVINLGSSKEYYDISPLGPFLEVTR